MNAAYPVWKQAERDARSGEQFRAMVATGSAFGLPLYWPAAAVIIVALGFLGGSPLLCIVLASVVRMATLRNRAFVLTDQRLLVFRTFFGFAPRLTNAEALELRRPRHHRVDLPRPHSDVRAAAV